MDASTSSHGRVHGFKSRQRHCSPPVDASTQERGRVYGTWSRQIVAADGRRVRNSSQTRLSFPECDFRAEHHEFIIKTSSPLKIQLMHQPNTSTKSPSMHHTPFKA